MLIIMQVNPGNGKLTLLKTQKIDTSGSGKKKAYITLHAKTHYTSIFKK